MLSSFRGLLAIAVVLGGCGGGDSVTLEPGNLDDSVPPLPAPVANNAVAGVTHSGDCTLFSALGIGAGLDHTAVSAEAHAWREGDDEWTTLPTPPSQSPRVAASAVAIAGRLFLLGGYSIAEDGGEVSFDTLDVFDLDTGQWSSAPALPVAIDDAVALAWRDRYLVVVSGWSDTGSIATVQIYDSQSESWSLATDFPGTPVFGHAGALVGDNMVIIDGVGSAGFGFELVNQAWLGQLDPEDPTTIAWSDLGGHPGPARYRAAGGTTADGASWFHGGTEVPYNFDGLAYDGGQPAPPLPTTLVYLPDRGFAELGLPKPAATMDHRALARCGSTLYAIGGMTAGPAVSDRVWRITAP